MNSMGSKNSRPQRQVQAAAKCTCREGAMSSSDATISWVATSGFHCSAEHRLRLHPGGRQARRRW
jgi:hypothetical protein